MKEYEIEDCHPMSRRRLIKALPFVAAGGVMMLLSSCETRRQATRRYYHGPSAQSVGANPPRSTARLTTRRFARRR